MFFKRGPKLTKLQRKQAKAEKAAAKAAAKAAKAAKKAEKKAAKYSRKRKSSRKSSRKRSGAKNTSILGGSRRGKGSTKKSKRRRGSSKRRRGSRKRRSGRGSSMKGGRGATAFGIGKGFGTGRRSRGAIHNVLPSEAPSTTAKSYMITGTDKNYKGTMGGLGQGGRGAWTATKAPATTAKSTRALY